MQWKAVAEFVNQMAEQHGFNQDELNSLFSQVHYLEKVVKLINPAPSGKSKTGRLTRAVLLNHYAYEPDYFFGKNMKPNYVVLRLNSASRLKS